MYPMEVSNPWRFRQVLMSLDFTMDTDLHPSCFRLYFVLHFPATSVCYREIIYRVLKTTQFSSAYYAPVHIPKLIFEMKVEIQHELHVEETLEITSTRFCSVLNVSMVFWSEDKIPFLMLSTHALSSGRGHNSSMIPSWKEKRRGCSSRAVLNSLD